MEKPIEVLDIDGFKVKIFYDSDPQSPREWDNLGTMACWHRKYNLGDKRDFANPEEFDESIGDPKIYNAIILPLYLYDHSGITMRTTPFSCPWDSGQVGFIYVTAEKAKKEYGWKKLTRARKQKIEDHLRREVEVYDQFLRGDVFGYQIEDADGIEIDSCWGFFGSNHEKSGLIENVRRNTDWEIQYKIKEDAALNVCMAL